MKNYNRVPSIKLNNQAALDYTLYMMTSSRFKRCEISSLILEEQLYHRYRRLRPAERDVLEKICIGASDHYFPSVLPAYIWDCKVCVRLKKHPEDGFTSVIFDGSIFVLEISAQISGARRVLFSYEYREEDGKTITGTVAIRHRVPKSKKTRGRAETDIVKKAS